MSQAREDAKIFFEKEDVEQEIKTMLSQISSDAAKGFSLMSNLLVRRMLAMCAFVHVLARLVGSSYISRKKSVSACYFVFLVYFKLSHVW